MYEYSVVFTNNSGKFSILIKEAANEIAAIEAAIIEAKTQGFLFYEVAAFINI